MKRSIYFAVFFAISILFLASSSTYAQQNGKGLGNANAPKVNWVDADGDGICDNFGTAAQSGNVNGKRYGLKNGTGTQPRPQDGTGFGAKAGMGTGTGTCDGTGPKGAARRGGK